MNDNNSGNANYLIELSEEAAYEPLLLAPAATKHLGEYKQDQVRNIKIRVGQKPYAVNLTDLFLRNKDENFKKYAIFEDFNICILFQTIHVLDEGGVHNLVKLGYRTKFVNNSPVTVVEVLPRTEFIEATTGKLNASFDATGTLGMSFPESSVETAGVAVESGASLKVAVGAEFKCNLTFSVVTPKIIAIGSGDNTSEWIFNRHNEPLIGSHQVVQLLLVRKALKKVKFEFNVYATVRFFGYPTKYSNDQWFPLEVEIMKIAGQT